ncbi:MAG: hypothetical protein ACOYN4_07685 [Bacteroidales bacterium]
MAIKRNPEQLIKLGGKIFSKHQNDGAASPLKSLVDNDWDVTGPKIAACAAYHQKAEEFKRQMENAYQERDKVLAELEDIVRNSAALLKGIYRKSPKKLGEWGFDVSDTPATPKAPVL